MRRREENAPEPEVQRIMNHNDININQCASRVYLLGGIILVIFIANTIQFFSVHLGPHIRLASAFDNRLLEVDGS